MTDASKAAKMRKTQLEIVKSVTTLSEATCRAILQKSSWNTRIALDSFYSAKFMTQKYAKDQEENSNDQPNENDNGNKKKGWFKSWKSFAKSDGVNDKMMRKAMKVIKRGNKENMQQDEIESFLKEKGFTEDDIKRAYAEYNKSTSASIGDD